MLARRTVWIAGIILLGVAVVTGYSTYSEQRFVDVFIKEDQFDERLDQVTIWETNSHLNESLANAKRSDEQLEKVRQALEDWQVRKTFFKNMDYEEAYQIDISYGEDTLTIPISSDGLMNIQGHTYVLVDGPQIEELLVLLE
ncbi:hypothetical protein [Lysinibacillus odysseyi]|uniref:Uncharacterized protein n=1 Tax=Lysinibacillus odysseyi 34hs-1 = NBRC 100172 TaxID=1220589 RepID=A0A0A3IHV9_9BACI|nr:hypothetical protein [Lysinibacillus odysseyi]KGR84346.1 hypothetical protein CD32_12180 [Lysinibacillus odysseyi 34hs-1 = NBRC 100172]